MNVAAGTESQFMNYGNAGVWSELSFSGILVVSQGLLQAAATEDIQLKCLQCPSGIKLLHSYPNMRTYLRFKCPFKLDTSCYCERFRLD